MSILVVDDTSIMRFILKDVLVKYCRIKPHDIHEAAGGIEAIEKYRILKPKIVFLDITMPDKDGITVVKELVQLDPEARIIMCTSSTGRKDVVECIRSGAIDYIIKPPQPDRVAAAIRKAELPSQETKTEETAEDENNQNQQPVAEAPSTVIEQKDGEEVVSLKKYVLSLKQELSDLKTAPSEEELNEHIADVKEKAGDIGLEENEDY